ncbi:glycosyltransferase family 2 protein [Rhodococcus sp. NPDC003318]|uniref:glycosyltransferase family 2 protein n=1 Tax=Rhodococcus sp. NPDC003318 TaxID=3364503 RepID=UPI003692D7C5
MTFAKSNLDLNVVIPAFRAEKTIRRAIKSAYDAGATAAIVIDDGSDDRTAEVARSAGAYCVTQENSGAARARAVGAEIADSKYIIFLDADDELIPSGVRMSVNILDDSPHLAVAAGTVVGVAEGGTERPFPIRFSPVTTKTLLSQGFGPWPPCAAVVRREAYNHSKSLDPAPLAPRFAEDYELLIRLSMIGDIDVRDEPTCRYSLAGGKSVRSATTAIEAKENIRRHYATHLGLAIESMSENQIRMAATARRARAEWAAGNRFATAGQLTRWFLADPKTATRKLVSQPWKRN